MKGCRICYVLFPEKNIDYIKIIEKNRDRNFEYLFSKTYNLELTLISIIRINRIEWSVDTVLTA